MLKLVWRSVGKFRQTVFGQAWALGEVNSIEIPRADPPPSTPVKVGFGGLVPSRNCWQNITDVIVNELILGSISLASRLSRRHIARTLIKTDLPSYNISYICPCSVIFRRSQFVVSD